MSRFLEQFKLAGGDVEGVMERFMDDEELFKDCLAQFMGESDFDKLKLAIESQQYKEAFEIGHSLKGVSGNLGIMSVYVPLIPLVESLRGNHTEPLAEQLDTVLKAREEFLEKYKEMV